MPHKINEELRKKMFTAIVEAIAKTSAPAPEDREAYGDTLIIPVAEACDAMIDVMAGFLESRLDAVKPSDLREISKTVAVTLRARMLAIRARREDTGGSGLPVMAIRAN
ncbi:hypothetical protein KFK14_19675 [Sphingobium phenoxybenzoativorans]|uniref:Uncharacterized protein n=1 Tax=Sphingobium phenoxybenzoativorans TaxID=1592790 RepID=A0A975K655_9SPHN|nr:hypothetical protein [Sphingobium phenoxybenzoativorans]QUT05192.1 hypothetical protein KFK14_19675 [Sphingobium phenoxybenzoativorans]